MLNDKQKHFINAIAQAVAVARQAPLSHPSEPHTVYVGHLNPHHAEELYKHRPTYQIEGQMRTCTLHRVKVSDRNGETIGEYNLNHRGANGYRFRMRIVFAVRGGRLQEISRGKWRVL